MIRDRDRACPVPGCPGTARAGHLLCRWHWQHLRPATKRRLKGTWRAVRMAMRADRPATAFRRPLPAYREAVEAALVEVALAETEEVCHVL